MVRRGCCVLRHAIVSAAAAAAAAAATMTHSFITKMRRYAVAASSHSGANTPANEKGERMRKNPPKRHIFGHFDNVLFYT